MKIELNVVGLIQHLDFLTGSVTCTALVQSETGDLTELPISETFAERLAAQHAAEAPRGMPQLQGVPVPAHLRQNLSRPMHSSEIEIVSTGIPAQAAAVLNAIEENEGYEPSEAEFEILARAGIDVVSMVQSGELVPGSRATQQEPREFGLESEEGAAAPSLGSLFGSDNEDAEKELTATKKAIADLKDKARRAPRPPRTVPHDDRGNPVVEQRPQAKPRKGGGSGDDLFGQG